MQPWRSASKVGLHGARRARCCCCRRHGELGALEALALRVEGASATRAGVSTRPSRHFPAPRLASASSPNRWRPRARSSPRRSTTASGARYASRRSQRTRSPTRATASHAEKHDAGDDPDPHARSLHAACQRARTLRFRGCAVGGRRGWRALCPIPNRLASPGPFDVQHHLPPTRIGAP